MRLSNCTVPPYDAVTLRGRFSRGINASGALHRFPKLAAWNKAITQLAAGADRNGGELDLSDFNLSCTGSE